MTTARTRATTQLYDKQEASNRKIVESLQANTKIEVLDEKESWLKVKEYGDSRAIPGWALRDSFIFPPPEEETLFKNTLHERALAIDAQTWQSSDALDRPKWISEFNWRNISANEQQNIKDGIRKFIQTRQSEWNAWLTNKTTDGRADEALLVEGSAALQGGRDVWSVRAEQIYPQAAEKDGIGWVNVTDVMRWTGNVKRNNDETKYKTWYEVSLYKAGKQLKGWYKAALIEPYFYPTEANDTSIEANKDTQFDLTQPCLRLPADAEIDDALNAKRSGLQYIDLFNVLGIHKIHYNLCGEFCAATLLGVDIIPLLSRWKSVYSAADGILRNGIGTGLADLETIFKMYNRKFDEYQFTLNVTSPARLLKLLENGRKYLCGVAIFKANGKLAGSVSTDKTTRHWIVLEDVIPVGNSGWVRIYNPFRNREEVYEFNLFLQSVGQFNNGLWVDMPDTN